MKFDNSRLVVLSLRDAHCECGAELKTVSNGLTSEAFYCHKCENVYVLKMIKVSDAKIGSEFLEQCRKDVGKA